MLTTRKVALRVNGVPVANARVHRSQKGPELVIADPLIGEFVIDESFTVELLELAHPLSNGGWRRVSLGILILLENGVVGAVQES